MSVTIVLVLVTFLISYRAFNNPRVFHALKHHPYSEHRNREHYRLLSSGFVHGSWIHLLINLFVLYQFGPIVERIYENAFGVLPGRVLFTAIYLLTIIVADLPTFWKHKDNPSYAAIGASGAVSGVVFIYILYFPWAMLSLYGILPFPAIVGGIAYLVYSSWASKNRNDNIDHSAHFYGALFGISVTIALKPSIALLFAERFINGLPF